MDVFCGNGRGTWENCRKMRLFEGYPYLENEKILIHRLAPEDAVNLARLAGDERVYTYEPTFLYETKYDDAALVIAREKEELFDRGEGILLGVYLKGEADGAGETFTGLAEIYNYEEAKSKASIGVRLLPEFWRRGISTAVIGMLRDYLTGDAGIETVTAHIISDNKASAACALKNGFVRMYSDLLADWGLDDMVRTDKYVYKASWAQLEDGDAPLKPVHVEQFVMAYGADQDQIRAMLPEGYESLRPVLRINTEIRDDKVLYIEFNTPVAARGKRGWLNIANWKSTRDPIAFERGADGTVYIKADFLELKYKGTGARGGCPAERDNDGCFFIGNDTEFRPAEVITENKEFCDCSFRWKFGPDDAHGESEGVTLPAFYEEAAREYERAELSAKNAARIFCRKVLGAYIVRFVRER